MSEFFLPLGLILSICGFGLAVAEGSQWKATGKTGMLVAGLGALLIGGLLLWIADRAYASV